MSETSSVDSLDCVMYNRCEKVIKVMCGFQREQGLSDGEPGVPEGGTSAEVRCWTLRLQGRTLSTRLLFTAAAAADGEK